MERQRQSTQAGGSSQQDYSSNDTGGEYKPLDGVKEELASADAPPVLDKHPVSMKESAADNLDLQPQTSAAAKSDVPMETNMKEELLGPVLDLPEPGQSAEQLYELGYEYFGDSLAMRLPVVQISNFYVASSTCEAPILLGDENSKKSGEELLQEILDSKPVGRGMRKSTESLSQEVKSEVHGSEDMDVDVDEKSSRSGRSSRSSRSDRSHSEDLSFLGLGEDADLTVQATVSDPSMGIKLFISKKPKSRVETEKAASDVPLMPKLSSQEALTGETRTSAPKLYRSGSKPSGADSEPVFDRVPIQSQEVTFVFRFLGREQVCKTERNRIRSTELIRYQLVLSSQVTETSQLSKQMKQIGPRSGRPNQALKHWKRVHHSGGMFGLL